MVGCRGGWTQRRWLELEEVATVSLLPRSSCCKVISSCHPTPSNRYSNHLLFLFFSYEAKLRSVSCCAAPAQSSFVSIILCAENTENTKGKFVLRRGVKTAPHSLSGKQAEVLPCNQTWTACDFEISKERERFLLNIEKGIELGNMILDLECALEAYRRPQSLLISTTLGPSAPV